MAARNAVEPPLVAVVGPTASGKTSLSIQIAKQVGGEIICADSRTVYRGMDIGTAKPTIEETGDVPHWGLDLVAPNETYSAAAFQQYAAVKIAEIRTRGNVPIMVGGTGLYTDAVLYGYSFSGAGSTEARKLQSMTEEQLAAYCEEHNINRNDLGANPRHFASRLAMLEGRKQMRTIVLSNTIVVGIATNKQEIEHRIGLRSEQIFATGVIEEAMQLGAQYGWGHESMTGNIYPIIKEYLDSVFDIEEAKKRFSISDRQLAKRQMTWFRRNPDICWGLREELAGYVINKLTR